MFGSTIAKRVARVIKDRTAAAEARYKEVSKQINLDYLERIDALTKECEQKKADVADDLVKDILGIR